MNLVTLVWIAGLGQIVLVCASLTIPRVLGWREELQALRPLTRQVFWTYAGYILCLNLCFGLLSTLAPRLLVDGSRLATAVSGFIALYWGARIAIQFFYFDRSSAPAGRLVRLAEVALVGLFLFLTLVYGVAAGINLRGGVA